MRGCAEENASRCGGCCRCCLCEEAVGAASIEDTNMAQKARLLRSAMARPHIFTEFFLAVLPCSRVRPPCARACSLDKRAAAVSVALPIFFCTQTQNKKKGHRPIVMNCLLSPFLIAFLPAFFSCIAHRSAAEEWKRGGGKREGTAPGSFFFFFIRTFFKKRIQCAFACKLLLLLL